ncbi:hypothetical protein E3E15_03170 [Allofrancisella frigidaquae]|uniref:C2H2-type domain-containing protein n=1 Tax=Allofrancisella frigidaquae TaxID=1085644 RepID=A0A6M3HT84_9GAMM|nr:hypothetical protein E3E15_03170 [Allofrancisella frigidaquae]
MFTCQICQKSFTDKNQFRIHTKIKHGTNFFF